MSIRASLQKQLSEFTTGQCDRSQFLARVTELLAETLGCTRASIWRFSPSHDQLVCEDLYLADLRRHRQGDRVLRIHHPDYFWCMEESRAIVAPEARIHSGTASFNEDYFLPLDIHSLLDSAILRKGGVEGVVRCEQTGQPRHWQSADILAIRTTAMMVGSAGA